jgi:hypothetical protein
VEDKYFYSSGQILPSEEWHDVFVYNDETVVDMLGGTVGDISAFNASTLNIIDGIVDGIGAHNTSKVNILDGHVNTLDALEFSSVNVSGGYVDGLSAQDNAFVTFSDNAQALSLSARELGTVVMSGGITDYLRAGQSGNVNLRTGTISEYLNAWDLAVVNIYGYGFTYDPSGGAWDGGQLKGFYLNGSSFILDLYDEQTYEHVNLVPEPASLLMLGFGSLVLRRTHNISSSVKGGQE